MNVNRSYINVFPETHYYPRFLKKYFRSWKKSIPICGTDICGGLVRSLWLGGTTAGGFSAPLGGVLFGSLDSAPTGPLAGLAPRASWFCAWPWAGDLGCIWLPPGEGGAALLLLVKTDKLSINKQSEKDHTLMILVKKKGNLWTRSHGYFIFCVPRHKEILAAYLSSYGGETLFLLLVCEWGLSSRSHAIGYTKRRKPCMSW